MIIEAINSNQAQELTGSYRSLRDKDFHILFKIERRSGEQSNLTSEGEENVFSTSRPEYDRQTSATPILRTPEVYLNKRIFLLKFELLRVVVQPLEI